MADMNIFEAATRAKLRFSTAVGWIGVEDLWDAPLARLDRIAIDLHGALKTETISFVDDEVKGDAKAQLAFDVVKWVIDVKKVERKAALDAKAKRDEKQKLLAALARAEDRQLEGKTADELRALIEAL